MRFINRLIGGLHNSDANKENNTSRERKNEGTRAKADKKRNMSAKKLGLEALEERQLLSVNPIAPSDYQDLRENYPALELPADANRINVISVDKLDAESLQAAVDQAAKTEADDLIVINASQDDYVLDLDKTAVTINLNSAEYGKLKIVGNGDAALTVVTRDSNALTVLNGDVAIDGMVMYNYSTSELEGGLVLATNDANVTYGDQLFMVNDVNNGESYNLTTLEGTTVVDPDLEVAEASAVSGYRESRYGTIAGDYKAVSDRINATIRRPYDYFGFNPSEYNVVGGGQIYDAECTGMAGWVGTMANMLSYTGWAKAAGFSTRMTLSDGTVKNYDTVEDAVVDYLRNNFMATSGGTATDWWNLTTAEMLDYFFSGNDKDCMGRNLSALTNTVEGGGFFMDIDFEKVGGYVPASATMMQDLAATLRAGNAVTLEVETTDNWGNRQRSYVSVWGYTYNQGSLQYYGMTTNSAAPVYGLLCSNPLYGTYRSDASYNYYGNDEKNGAFNGSFYTDQASGTGYDTYHRYLLTGADSLTLVTEPDTYIDNNGNLVNEKQMPEGYQYFQGYRNNHISGQTYTSTIVGFSWLAQYANAIPECEMNADAVFSLESMPGNTENVIYLYFDPAGTGWDNMDHPGLNLDNSAGFSVAELQAIEEVWQRVSEDYAPFSVNVTTDPNVWASAKKGIRCVIGGFDPSKGGVSGVGSFGTNKADNYVFPFSLGLNTKNIAEAATHEIGHSLGLGHDGYEHNEYYQGQNSAGWAPIMGSGYHQPMTQWSCGDYVNATNFEDDIAKIASVVGFRKDEHGNTIENATDLNDFYVDVDLNQYDPTAGTYHVESIIIDRNDVDVFSFVSYGGTYVVDVVGAGADNRFIDSDFSWTTRRHADEENPVFGGKYYAKTNNYTNLNLKVSLLDETGATVLLDPTGKIMKLGYGEKTHAFESDDAYDSNYHFYVVDQFGKPVYLDDAKTILKEGYYAVDDSVYTTFSHFVTPELEAGKKYYISVEGTGQGSSSTNGYSDYGSIGQYTLSVHESYENFYLDAVNMDVTAMTNESGVDNVLNWKEAFVYSGRRLEDGTRYLGNTLKFNASLSDTTIELDSTLKFTYSRGIVNQPWAAKRFVLDAMDAWDNTANKPGITFDATGKFRTIYVDNTTLEMYGFNITGGSASRGTSTSQVNNGGGVYNNYGWLTIGNSVIAGNTALKAGAGIYNAGGEYEDNMQHDGWLYLINTSVIGNKLTGADAVGGGIFNESGAVATLVNVTVAGNIAAYSGGGIQNFGILNAYNSIVAKNYASYGADVYTVARKGTTVAYGTFIGDESRNRRLDAYRNGVDTINGGGSKIGTSLGGTVNDDVVVYDPEFVSYRDYKSENWSSELWKFWNLRLVGTSDAVDLGVTTNFTSDLDFGNRNIQASVYDAMGNSRYYTGQVDITKDLAGQNRVEGGTIDAGAYEVLARPDLTEFIPTSAGSDVVNNWESSIVISRAEDDQTGSVAPFLVDEPLYLNLSMINQGAAIDSSFETTIYMWKYDAYTSKSQMFAQSTEANGVAVMNIKVDFAAGAAMPGSGLATVTCTNLATGEIQTFTYDGLSSYMLLENVKLDSIENIVSGLIDKGVMPEQHEEGYFVFGYKLDSGDAIGEYTENNNFYRTSSYFDVVESPVSINDSIVVTTTNDVVDPYDGEISLREAVEVYAGSFYYAEIALKDGDVFEANGVTYKVINGQFYVDDSANYQVYPGEQFTIYKDVTIDAHWDAALNALVNADGEVVVPPTGTTLILGTIEHVFDGTNWVDGLDNVYTFADNEAVSWTIQESVVITYVVDVLYNEANEIVTVADGDKATIGGLEYTLTDGVWIHTDIVARYTRDDVQKQGSFTMEDGSVVTVVNGVFRRDMTDDVAIVPDGAVVTLANGETAVYDFAQDRFVVTNVLEKTLVDGDTIVVDGAALTFVADSYVDDANTRYFLDEGTEAMLSNGFKVVYEDDHFVYSSVAVSSTKLPAGTTVILNGEEYSYKAGRALVKRVSRESNAVVFAPELDGETFELVNGPLTLNKTFTLDCVDPEGNLLDLTITSQSDDPCLFLIEQGADVTIKNFKFEGATSNEDGAILKNLGKLTVDRVTFSGNVAHQGNLIYNAKDSTLNVVGSVFENNYAENSALIYNLGSANIMDGTTFTGDEALLSPIYSQGTLTVDETTFTKTSGENGGAILNDGGSAVVARSEFNETVGANKGGAIANFPASDLHVYNSTFNGSKALMGGAIFNGENSKLTVEAAIFTGAKADGEGGAIYNGGVFEDLSSTYTGNKAHVGAAVYNLGEFTSEGSKFSGNTAVDAGGAVYAGESSTMRIIGGTFVGNAAVNGAAVYAGGAASLENSLFADNKATGLGGAVYVGANTSFVNVTIADNKANDGAGIYNAGTATIDNSILADNLGTAGNDVYTKDGATTLLRNSLLKDIAKIGEKAFDLDANYRSILGVDPQLNDDYTLKATSPAVNAGNNALDKNAEFDLAGNVRRVGLLIGGVIRSIDMGAFEYQTVVAPDLAINADSVDYWGAEVTVNGVTTELDYFVAGEDVCIDFNIKNVGDGLVIDNFGFNVKLVGVDSNGAVVYDQLLPTQYYANDFVNFNWLNTSDWIGVNGEATLMTNFGSLPAGYYTVTVTLDVFGAGSVYEYGEEDGFDGENNNVFEGSFQVFSAPSTVVTTDKDVVDPTDGETSIREAVDAAGDYTFSSTYLVPDGTTFTLENGEVLTVVNGWLTQAVDCVTKDGVQIDLQEGDEFLLSGRPIFYHYQMNGGYFTYGSDPDSSRVPQSALESGNITYPDGTSASFQLQTDQYIHFVDDTDLNPQEGTHYTYNVLKTPEGDVVLTDGMEFSFSNVNFTYYQNETYPHGAFEFEDGTFIEYEDGGTLNFASLAIGSLSTRYARVEKAVILADGSTLEVKNGVARVTKDVTTEIAFDKAKMQDKTIVVDPAKGPIVLDKTTVLRGSDVVVERESVSILGEDRNVSISGNDATNMVVVNSNADITISDLTLTQGYAKVGGAILNRGELNLENVNFTDNEAYWIKNASGDGYLTEGLGGAIANYGYLTVDGGTFSANKATDFGGAIYSNTEGSTIVSNAEFTGNKAFAGGAIVAQTGKFAVENSTFTGNTAERAGAIYTLVNATIMASSFIDNSAVAADFASRNVVGGAIYASKTAKLNFAADPTSDSTVAVVFKGNTAEAGGAVYAEAGIKIDGDIVAENNSAVASKYVDEVKGDYGAIFANGNVDITGSATFTGNTADGSYGALYANGKLTVGRDAAFNDNEAKTGEYGAVFAKGIEVKGNLDANNNAAGSNYGAIYSKKGIEVGGDLTANNNVSGGKVGAVGAVNAIEVAGNLTANNNTAVENEGAIIAGSLNVGGNAVLNANKGANYGAAYVKGAFEVGGNLEMVGNTAAEGFGAAYVGGALNVTGNANISGNKANSNAGIDVQSLNVGGDLTANDNNAAVDALGAIASRSGVEVGGAAEIKNNVGGGIVANGGVTVGAGATLENNEGLEGAAIKAEGKVFVTGDVVAKNNIAKGNGGAISAQAFEATGALTATGNTADGKGGAIASASYVKIGEGASNISGNKAGLNGGAIYAIDSVEVGGDAVVSANAAGLAPAEETVVSVDEKTGEAGETIRVTVVKKTYNSLGGAIFVAEGGAVFGGNVAFDKNESNYGGALVTEGDEDGVEVAGNASFTNNIANGVVVTETTTEVIPADGGESTVTTETTTENIGSGGAALIGGDLNVKGILDISGNTANAKLGGVYVVGGVDVVGDATIADNTAQTEYGGLSAKNAAIGGNLIVSGNKAVEGFVAGIVVEDLTVEGKATFVNNSAGAQIGALYANNVTIAGDALFDGNYSAKGVGGAYVSGKISINGNTTIANNKTDGVISGIYAKEMFVGGNVAATDNSAMVNNGAISVYGEGLALEIVGDAYFKNNTAANRETVEVSEPVVVVENSVNEAGQKVRTTTTTVVTTKTLEGQVGALLVSKGSAKIGGNTTFEENKASALGAFYVAKDLEVGGDLNLLNNSSIGYKFAETAVTTLVEVLDEAGEVVSSTSNTDTTTAALPYNASYGAGAVMGNATIGGDAVLSGNSSNLAAGAIRVEANMTVGGDLVATENKAAANYGAIAIGGDLTVEKTAKFENNSAGSWFGAGIVAGDVNVKGNVEVEEGQEAGDVFVLSGNTAGKAVGGLQARHVVIGGDALISGNKAGSGDYGAMNVESLTVDGDLTATGNSADSYGAIYAVAGLTVSGKASFVNNEARTGSAGAAYVNSAISAGSLELIGNKAAEDQGAIYADTNIEVAGDFTATDNKAGGSYGAFQAGKNVVVGGNVSLTGNEAGKNVGAGRAYSFKTTNPEASVIISNNTANGNVGALELSGSRYAFDIAGDAVVSGNKAGVEEIVSSVVEETTGENGEKIVTTTTTTTTNGKYGAIAVLGGSIRVGGDLEVAGNSAAAYGALYSKNDIVVGGGLVMKNNEANGKVVTDVVVDTTVYGTAEDGSATETTTTTTEQTVSYEGADYGAAYARANVTVGGDAVIEGNKANGNVGALYAGMSFKVGSLTLVNNEALGSYGAIFTGSALKVDGALAASGNKAGQNVGAIKAGSVVVKGTASIVGNEAGLNYGAIQADSVDLNNALIADNKAAEIAGAIYANTLKLVNATVAGNTAYMGGGLFVVRSASIDNSILAGNAVTSKQVQIEIDGVTETSTIDGVGVDIYVVGGANIKLRNSLIQNAESTGDMPVTEAWFEEDYRCFVNVDPKFVDAANGNYSLSKDSPAINTASNKLAISDVETDLAGNPRYVGVEVDGVIYSIDMGAFEYQEVITSDLAFNDDPVNFWFATVDGNKTDHYIYGQNVVLDFSIANLGDAAVYDKFWIMFELQGQTAAGDDLFLAIAGKYDDGADFYDWLQNEDWLAAGSEQSYVRQDLGKLPVGDYTVTITLDYEGEIIEADKTNNSFTTAFQVYEAPTTVVNTEEDGEYNPLDDKVTLREASELYAGPYWYSSDVLINSGVFVREDMVVVSVAAGVATTDRNVVVIDDVETTLTDGMKLAYGQTYITYENGTFTYPDGSVQAYAPGRFDYNYSITLTLADGTEAIVHRESKFDYLESQGVEAPVSTKYEYVDVYVAPDGSKTLLDELQADSVVFSTTYMTYQDNIAVDSLGKVVVLANGTKIVYEGSTGTFMNGGFISDDGEIKIVLPAGANIELVGEEANVPAAFKGSAFVLEDGSYVEFEDGKTIDTELGVVVENAVRKDVVTEEITTIDGIKYNFANDGAATVSTFVGNEITFADGVEGIELKGDAIAPRNDQTIFGDNVTISGVNATTIFAVNHGLNVEMNDLNLTSGRGVKGGAIYNAGNLTLNNVNIENSTAYSATPVDPTEKVLHDGFGGAVYNSGNLTINGGEFIGNVSEYFGGAIYSIGGLTISDAEFVANASDYFGGAVYIQNSNAAISNSEFIGNAAKYNGGAVAVVGNNADANVSFVNTLFAENSSKQAEGGAIYALSENDKNVEVQAVNTTIVNNAAAIGGGVAVDGAKLIVKNSIIANNKAGYQGKDLAIEGAGTVEVYAGLIGNAEDVVNAGALIVADGFSAFMGTNANPVDAKLDSNYVPTSTSPAVNSGVNAFIEGVDKDLAGNDRVIGDRVDMGAFELGYVAPDLTFGSDNALNGWFATVDDGSKFVEGWDVCFDYAFGNFGSGVVLNSFNYTITVERLDSEGNPVAGSAQVFTRTYGDDVDGYMSEEYWLSPNAMVNGYWNVGALAAGRYQATLTLDVDDTVLESSNENNAFTTTFDVIERPSLVVDTELDVVDEFDGLTSLREAISLVGSEMGDTISMKKLLVEGAAFTLATGEVVTYADGVLSYEVETKIPNEEGEEVVTTETFLLEAGVSYTLENGEELVWDGADEITLSSSIVDTITFAPELNGKTIALTDGELQIDRDMVISASADQDIKIDANNASRVFFVAHGEVRIGGLTLLNAKDGAIYNAGDLYVNDVKINSASAADGAGIYNAEKATAELWNVEFADMNATGKGGAIYNAGSMLASIVKIDGASATDGGAIYNAGDLALNQADILNANAGDQGGAIYNEGGYVKVNEGTFVGNSAQYGGAILNYQGVVEVYMGAFDNNTASGDAGAIDNYGDLDLVDVKFTGNTAANGFGGAIYNSQSTASDAYVVIMSNVEFKGNSASKGGAIYNAANSELIGDEGPVSFSGNSAVSGGAIYNVGSIGAGAAWTFEANKASENGGALYNAGGSAAFDKAAFIANEGVDGAAVYNSAAFMANNASFKANAASGNGAALYNAKGSSAVSNGLFWLNTAVNGGAIYNAAGSTTLRNATIGANAAEKLAGGVYNAGTFKAYNTIVASNYAENGADLYSTTSNAKFYYSLVGTLEGVNKKPTMTSSKVGSAGFVVDPVFVNGEIDNADSVDLLLTADSAAVNAGKTEYALDTYGNKLTFDLDGNDRVCTTLDAVDMGAYEFPFEEPSTVVTTNLDVDDPTDGVISLREAIAYAQRLGQDVVTFDPSVTNAILNSTLYIDSNISISSGEGDFTITGSGFKGSLVVVGSENEDAVVEFFGVDFKGGNNAGTTDDPDNAGGAIRNYATVTLDFVSVMNNSAAYGGGIYNAGTMTIVDSDICDNSASYYGGIYNRGVLTVDRTVIAGNTAEYYGGGIGTYTEATVLNSAIVGNVASLGAGVYSQVNMADLFNSDAEFDVNLINTTIVGNKATGAHSDSIGAGVWANHVMNVTNSIVYGNVASAAADVYATTIMATSKTTFAYSNIGVSNIAVSGVKVQSTDPKFIDVDPAKSWKDWDLALQIGSSMIDAGNSAAAGEYDIEFNERVVGSAVDIGAYEEQGNLAPTDIKIELTEGVLSTAEVGSVVATLEAIDPNADDTAEFELVDDCDGAFKIAVTEDGDVTVVTARPVAAGDYTIVVKATDSGDASFVKSFNLVVTDPAAPEYLAPTVTSLGRNVNNEIVVQWDSAEQAKEYVVEYRVQGTDEWISTAALTGTFGLIYDNFEDGDVVEVRIRALASSVKNGSEWSEIAQYTIEKAPEAVSIVGNINADGSVSFAIDSNANAHAYWKVDWNDGSEPTVSVGLSMSGVFSHWYMASGVYTPTLYLDNSEVGIPLDVINVDLGASAAVIDADVENVFSELEPVAVGVALMEDTDVQWNAISQSVSVAAGPAPKAAVAAKTDVVETAAVTETREAVFADLVENDADDFELDSTVDSIFDEDFVNDLFEN